MSVFVSCGEVSGDLYAADLIQELLKEDAGTVAAIISAAFADAKFKADKAVDDIMGKATGGMTLPA